jgi:hypothetical protein
MIFVLVLLLLTGSAAAHEGYDPDCCNERHCHPVPDGMVKETERFIFVPGYAPVPKISPKARWSHDAHDHLCTSDDGQILYCVYRAQRGM